VLGCSTSETGLAWKWTGEAEEIYKLYFNSKRKAFLVLEKYGDLRFLNEESGHEQLRIRLEFPERDGHYVGGLDAAGYDDNSGVLALAGTINAMVHLLDVNKLVDHPVTQMLQLGSFVYWAHPPMIPNSDKTSLVVSFVRKRVNKANLGDLSLSDESPEVTDVAVCEHAQTIIAISDDGWFVGWTRERDAIKYRRHVITSDGSSGYLLSVGCSSHSVAITTGVSSYYGTIQLWDIDAGTLADHEDLANVFLIGHGQSITSDEEFVASNGDIAFVIWRIADSKLTQEARIFHKKGAPNELRNNLAFQRSGHLLAITEARSLYVVDVDKASLRCISAPTCVGLELLPARGLSEKK